MVRQTFADERFVVYLPGVTGGGGGCIAPFRRVYTSGEARFASGDSDLTIDGATLISAVKRKLISVLVYAVFYVVLLAVLAYDH